MGTKTTPNQTGSIVVRLNNMKGGRYVVCETEEEARRAAGMDAFAAWLKGEVL